jgi:hypothetical protein
VKVQRQGKRKDYWYTVDSESSKTRKTKGLLVRMCEFSLKRFNIAWYKPKDSDTLKARKDKGFLALIV